MTEDPRPTGTTGGPMSERMQALLSRAAEEQLIEQRQVSAVLGELRGLITGLAEQLRGTASSARLESVGGDVTSLSAELRSSTTALGERVDALGALRSEISALHDQLDPLAEVRTTLVELSARTGELEAVRPELAALGNRLQGLATLAANDMVKARDGLQDLMTERLDRLEALASRPALTQEGLEAALAPLLAHVATGPQVVERLGSLDGRLTALEDRLGALAGAADLTELRAEVQAVRGGIVSLQEDTSLPSLVLGVAGLREDVEEVSARLADLHVPTAEAVAVAVEQQVVDPLVDGLTERVRAATVESERRLSAHVDEAVLVLAEALLRRRRVMRSGAGALGGGSAEDGGLELGGSSPDVPAPAVAPAAAPAPPAQPVVSSPGAAVPPAAVDESGASAGVDVPVAASGGEDETGEESAAQPVEGGPAEGGDAGASVDPAVQDFSMPSIMTVDEDGSDSAGADGEDGDRRPWWRPSG